MRPWRPETVAVPCRAYGPPSRSDGSEVCRRTALLIRTGGDGSEVVQFVRVAMQVEQMAHVIMFGIVDQLPVETADHYCGAEFAMYTF